jgi:hypothetical protein
MQLTLFGGLASCHLNQIIVFSGLSPQAWRGILACMPHWLQQYDVMGGAVSAQVMGTL